MDWALARRRMVDGQLRPNRVSDARLLAALAEVPRERFVPADLMPRALADADLPLPVAGRVLMQPMSVARLVQSLGARSGTRALVLASGPGYGAALLARMGAEVTAVEESAALAALGRDLLPASVRVHLADPRAGWPESAPYDAILVEGAVERVPEAVEAQLAEGGRLATVLRRPDRAPVAVLGTRIRGVGSIPYAVTYDLFTPLLPGFGAAEGGGAAGSGFVFA